MLVTPPRTPTTPSPTRHPAAVSVTKRKPLNLNPCEYETVSLFGVSGAPIPVGGGGRPNFSWKLYTMKGMRGGGHPKFLPPATKLGQGYVFTRVCDSVHRGVCLSACWDSTHTPRAGNPPGADTPRSRHPLGADHPPWEQTPTAQCMLWDTGNKRAVCTCWNTILYTRFATEYVQTDNREKHKGRWSMVIIIVLVFRRVFIKYCARSLRLRTAVHI